MDWTIFFILLIASFGAGATGALFPTGAWYAQLEKPTWTPPNWMFPVVWTTLYVLMAYAGARVATQDGGQIALALWAMQIAFNTLWTPVFFGLQRMKAGLSVLVALWCSVAAMTAAMWSVDWVAGCVMLPYVAWVSIAGALNASLIKRNPDQAK